METHYEKYLYPRLKELKQILSDNEIYYLDSMDYDGIPGITLLLENKNNLFVTFMEGDESGEEPELLRFTAVYDIFSKEDDEAASDFYYKSLIVPASEIEDIDSLKKITELIISGKCFSFYPTAELVKEPDKEAEGEANDNYDIAALPRINNLLNSLIKEGAEDCAVLYGKIPYILVADNDLAFVCAYEYTDDEYLLHFRADIPITDELSEKITDIITEFNEDHYFARAEIGHEKLNIYDDVNDNVLSIHACIYDSQQFKDSSYYSYFASMFENELSEMIESVYSM
ncbi:MAG: hypothetical protein IJR29_05840 [Butyrivibrio sp.]|nr:hypothetical protein [Butyrivibrio sp.]